MFKSALLLVTSAVHASYLGSSADVEKADPNSHEHKLGQSFMQAFQMFPPEIINEPSNNKKGLLMGTYLTFKSSGGAFTDGKYMNTTRIEGKNLLTGQESQAMKYMWKEGCSYTKWVPSNQFMYANLDYDVDTMTLERFGFIGM